MGDLIDYILDWLSKSSYFIVHNDNELVAHRAFHLIIDLDHHLPLRVAAKFACRLTHFLWDSTPIVIVCTNAPQTPLDVHFGQATAVSGIEVQFREDEDASPWP
jgi:hypothetical protein